MAGDEVLAELARRARLELREDEMLARYGDEEFALLVSEADASEGRVAAERLRQAIARAPFATRAGLIEVTASFGVFATSPSSALTAAEVIHQADQRLYAAKHGGRNRVEG